MAFPLLNKYIILFILSAIIPYYVTVVLHSYGMGGEEAAPATQGEEHQLHNDDAGTAGFMKTVPSM